MKRYIWPLAFISTGLTILALFSTARPAYANHTGPCNPAPITTPSINDIAIASGFNAPQRLKECFQDTHNRYPDDLINFVYLEQDEYTLFRDIRKISTNMISVAWVSPTSASAWRNVRTAIHDSAVSWPGSGVWNETGVISFPSGNQFNLGNISQDESRGDSLPIDIDVSKLREGQNQIILEMELISDLPPGWSCIDKNGKFYSPPCRDSGTVTFYVFYNPNDRPEGVVYPPVGTPNSTCDSLNGTVSDADDPDADFDVTWFLDGVSKGTFRTVNHKFNIPIGMYKDSSVHNFKVYANGVKGNGEPDNRTYLIGETNIGPCVAPPPPPDISCSGISPGEVDPGQLFNLNVSFNNDLGGGTLNGATMTVTVSGGVYGPTVVAFTPNPLPPGVTANGTINSLTLPTAGNYTVTIAISGGNTPPGTPPCSHPLSSLNKPYFRVYGGDVLAGLPEFNSVGCSASTPGSRILGFAKDDGSGAATQLAAQAMSKIEEFSSAAGRAGPASPTEPTPPKGLTFANAGDPADAGSTYGGGFRDSRCPNPNYFGTSGPAPIITGPYSHPGAVIPAAATPTKVFVDGDVFIDANITYAAGPWTAPNIPSFYLIAKGNIYIDKDVTQLDGVYVAQPDAADARGNIYTCAKWTGITGALPDLDGTFMSECDGNPVPAALTVNGSFIARSIKLLRTNGSLRASIPTETATDPSIAEVFSFSPEMWLAAPFSYSSTTTGTKYDAISSMPPVL